jgi:hypothetical protein
VLLVLECVTRTDPVLEKVPLKDKEGFGSFGFLASLAF